MHRRHLIFSLSSVFWNGGLKGRRMGRSWRRSQGMVHVFVRLGVEVLTAGLIIGLRGILRDQALE
jgi:hypothetical protein